MICQPVATAPASKWQIALNEHLQDGVKHLQTALFPRQQHSSAHCYYVNSKMSKKNTGGPQSEFQICQHATSSAFICSKVLSADSTAHLTLAAFAESFCLPKED